MKKKEKKTLYENVIHQIKTLTDMETVETGIAEADMTNLAFTNRIRTFFTIQNTKLYSIKCKMQTNCVLTNRVLVLLEF